MFTLFLTFLGAAAAAAATGVIFQPGTWYDGLEKPDWTPPRWAFPVVWTALYILMAYAAARVAIVPGAGQALAFWGLQIALNTLWTPVFFGVHRMGLGMLVLALLWLAVLATLVAFWGIDWIAGLCLVPYLAWISVAAGLNWRVWRDNPAAGTAEV
ncbi:tryptophan-rich sensory protein TspO [Acidimangrovimonas sediminis]|uniref:tryptophan-rich sensory protein TspO n=1 Tax=Acidimangrovimonas sediminis TaxID=2056283 RepID=UPI000C7F803C|nr:TspO/MBR family protein [Acidimangrovimonas sediminis]